jgi:hypothetical protein
MRRNQQSTAKVETYDEKAKEQTLTAVTCS